MHLPPRLRRQLLATILPQSDSIVTAFLHAKPGNDGIWSLTLESGALIASLGTIIDVGL
jgi:hypothetical protein